MEFSRSQLSDPSNAGKVSLKDPASAFERVQHTLSEARELAIRIDGIAERLLGSGPSTGEAQNGARAVPTGILPNMVDDAERTQSYLRNAQSSLKKLEQALS